jgi:exopolysaccharide production protein ExoQ
MSENNQIASVSQPASLAERCFNVVFIVLMTGAFVNLFLTPEQILDPGKGMAGARYMWAAIYAGVLILWLRNCRGSIKLLLNERPILFLVLLAIASVIWSDAPATTFRRSLALVGTCLIALYFAVRFKIREQLQLLTWAFGICAACSLVFGIFHWGISVDNLEGAWFGIYTQRNSLGSMMVLSMLLFLVWGQIQTSRKWIAWMFAAISFCLIFLSGSMTSLIVASVLLLSFPMIRFLRSFKRAGTVIFVSAVLIVWFAIRAGASVETTAEAMGRDPSLTGRTELWAVSALIGFERPWLGFGYNAFWLGENGQSADVWKVVGWAAPSAHNGLLEIWLDLGAVGVALAAFSFAVCWRKALRLIRITRAWEYAWPLLFLVFLFVLNLTENAFLEGNSIHWFLYVVIALDLSMLTHVKSSSGTKNHERNDLEAT